MAKLHKIPLNELNETNLEEPFVLIKILNFLNAFEKDFKNDEKQKLYENFFIKKSNFIF